jgi:hypothetical protein
MESARLAELTIELRLLRNEFVAERNGLGPHRREQTLHLRSLLVGQRQRIRQFEHVHRPGIAVELGRKRETHAAARPQVADLLVGQCLDRPSLETRIGLV